MRRTKSAGPKPNSRIEVDRQREHLGIRRLGLLADEVAIELEKLPQPSLLRTLVAEETRDGKPLERLPVLLRVRGHHARETSASSPARRATCRSPLSVNWYSCWKNLRAALVFLRVKFRALERRTVVLDEAIPPRDRAPAEKM